MSSSTYPIPTSGTTQPPVSQASPPGTTAVRPATPASTNSMPVTGGDIVGISLLGAVVFAVGAAMVRSSRKARR